MNFITVTTRAVDTTPTDTAALIGESWYTKNHVQIFYDLDLRKSWLGTILLQNMYIMKIYK